jgi:multidrug efflux system membrane fusion protein
MQFPSYKESIQRLKHRAPILLGALALIIIAAIVIPLFWGNKQQAAQPAQPPAVPVTTAQVTAESVPLQISAIGTVEAYSKVSVTSEANGRLMKVYFTEGQYVKKGDPLFTIDPRTSQAELAGAIANQSRAVGQQRQAEANLAKDIAQARTAEVTAQRYETLYKEGVLSREQYDQARTNADALAAVVKADQAAIASERESVGAAKAAADASRVQLSFTEIRAPIGGRTGSLMINQGNVIKANDTNPLVVINQTTPIYVTFAVSETQLPDIKRYMAQGQLQVTALIPNDSRAPEQGTLSFVDNAVDTTTGTVKLKATFANDQQRLWPGLFVNTTLTLATQQDAIVVPSPAIQTGQQGRYVFVVKPDQTVEMRTVEVQRTMGEKSIIANGLSVGENVVTDGQLRLRPGSKIRTGDNKGGNKEKPAQQEHP